MPGRGDEISTLGVSTELAERSTPRYRSCVRRRMTQDHFASSGWQQMLTQNHANSILIHPEENLGTHYRPVEFNQPGFGRPYWILGVPWGRKGRLSWNNAYFFVTRKSTRNTRMSISVYAEVLWTVRSRVNRDRFL